jgi:hypothetical protein
MVFYGSQKLWKRLAQDAAAVEHEGKNRQLPVLTAVAAD